MSHSITGNSYQYFLSHWSLSTMLRWRNTIKHLFYLHKNSAICVSLIVFLVCITGFGRKKEYPVIVWWTRGFPGAEDQIRTCGNIQCKITDQSHFDQSRKVAYLFYGSDIDFKNLPALRSEAIWGLFHEESPRNVQILMHEKGLNLFNYSSTFSRYSDVPFPLQYLYHIDDVTRKEFYISTKEKNDALVKLSPVLYIQSDCETMTERDDYVSELMKYISVDSYGKCLNNKLLPEQFETDYLNNLDDSKFLKFVAKYKFTIAIENGICEDYVTEKFWRPIKVGSVPLYFGSTSITDWLPNPKSAILIDEFSSPKELAQYIKLLLSNDTLYEEYLDHKLKDRVSNLRLVSEFKLRPHSSDGIEVAQDFECFICKKLHKQDLKQCVVSRKQYDCPKPTSVLRGAQGENSWLFSWNLAKNEAETLYNGVMKN